MQKMWIGEFLLLPRTLLLPSDAWFELTDISSLNQKGSGYSNEDRALRGPNETTGLSV
jgi:hypothetical protein